MKKIIYLFLLISVSSFAQEKLTPELLFKLGRVNNPQVSPDAKTVLYEVKKYDLAANKGTNYIYTVASAGGTPFQVSDDATNAFDAKWRPDGKKISFLSTINSEVQLFEINLDGSAKTQITFVKGGIGSYKYAPNLSMIAYSADVKLDRTVAEQYADLPFVQARIIDGLFYRHWDAWHDYSYSHMFISPYTDGKLAGEATDIMKEEKYDAPLQPLSGVDRRGGE